MEINSGPLTFIQVSARGQRVGEREKMVGPESSGGTKFCIKKKSVEREEIVSERGCVREEQ